MEKEVTKVMEPTKEAPAADQADATPETTGDGMAAVQETGDSKSLEEQKKQLEREKEELRLSYLRLDTKQLLKENGLPEMLADHVMAADFAKTKAVVAELKAAFDNAVQQQVAVRLAGTTPRGGNEDYSRMNNITEQVKRSLA